MKSARRLAPDADNRPSIDPARVPDDHPYKVADESMLRLPGHETVVTVIREMFSDEFPGEYVLAFKHLHLRRVRGSELLWEVYTLYDAEPVDVLNLGAFRSGAALVGRLNKLAVNNR